ncbi:MAG TPA: GDSL-type esterase/lipase family protein [Planctomycetota bacterium]|nr:GDSL-type esterase/lipase family protein [Planctomycetota bacterium]
MNLPPPRRRRRLALAFGLLLPALLLGGGELLCRAKYGGFEFPPDWDLMTMPDPDLGRRFVPGIPLDFDLLGGRVSIPVRINRLGYRGGDPATEKPPGVFRVACLGDSTTFGWRVREEEAYPAVLEGLLAGRANGRRVEVLNFGAPEHTTFRARFVLEEALPLRPDVVLLAYGFNDSDLFEDEEALHSRRRASPVSLSAWRLRRLASGSYLYRWIEAQRASIRGPRPAPPPPPALVPRVSPEKMEANLRALAARARQAGAEVVFVDQNIPSRHGREAFRNAAADSVLVVVREVLFPGGNPLAPDGSDEGLEAAGERPGGPPALLLRLRAARTEAWDVLGATDEPGSPRLRRLRVRDDGGEGDEKAEDGVHSLLVPGPFPAPRVAFAFAPASFTPEVQGLFRSRDFFFHEEPAPQGLRITPLLSPGAPSPPMLPGDVIHPGPEGHRRIAEALAGAVSSTSAFRRFRAAR